MGAFDGLQIGGGGISGPLSVTDNGLATWNGTDGSAIQDGEVTLDDNADMTFPASGSISKPDVASQSEAFGAGAVANALQATALGNGADANGFNRNTAIGAASVANGDTSTAVGYDCDVIGTQGVGMGPVATIRGNFNTVYGYNATANGGNSSTAVGNSASVGSSSLASAFGAGASCNGNSALAMGQQASASGDAVAAGRGAQATASTAAAFGRGAVASATGAAALGAFSTASHVGGAALPENAQTTANHRVTIGRINSATIGHRKELELSGNLIVHGTTLHDQAIQALGVTSELVDLSLGATYVAAVPAGATVLAVSTRVTSAITGATSYDVGDGFDVDRWGAAIGAALGSTSNNEDWTDAALKVDTAAKSIVLTPNGGAFTGGNVRITVFYALSILPTA